MPQNWISVASSTLKCKYTKLPFTYLGVPVGGSPSRSSFWKPVIEKHLSKLAIWKCKNLSFGGRITLLKLVLSALPIYFFSVFKAPVAVCSQLRKIHKNFFWGGNYENRKISWVIWEKICLDKNKGGLSMPNIHNRNVSLLGKWWHKFYSNENNVETNCFT